MPIKRVTPSENTTGELTARIGYDFTNNQMLQDALTHPSLAGMKPRKKNGTTPYERLEFLGDRVLGLVIAAWIYELFPDENEGSLAKRHAALVNRDALHVIALEIGLERHLRLAHGEMASVGRKNLSTLSDAMEALIGAIYLDGGMEAAKRFIHRFWKQTTVSEITPLDPKTTLQEWAQGQGLPLPAYKVIERSGPAHAPKFLVEVSVAGYPAARAEGESKRAAEKGAAQALIDSFAANNAKTAKR